MDIPLVYLMNDAVESFLVFRNVRMTGEYHSDYQGELQASMTRQDGRFVLVIKQDDTVLTLFFEDLEWKRTGGSYSFRWRILYGGIVACAWNGGSDSAEFSCNQPGHDVY